MLRVTSRGCGGRHVGTSEGGLRLPPSLAPPFIRRKVGGWITAESNTEHELSLMRDVRHSICESPDVRGPRSRNNACIDATSSVRGSAPGHERRIWKGASSLQI